MAIRQKKTENKSVDVVMQKVALTLLRDFQTNLDEPGFMSGYEAALRHSTIPDVRKVNPTANQYDDPVFFKAAYQMDSLFKRYRFQEDTYSDQELVDLAIAKFIEVQDRLATIDLGALPAEGKVILRVAASYVAKVLGPYSDEEHRNLCRFGRKASVGIPARKANLAERFEIPISGSTEQISWFDSEMSQDCMLQEYWRKQKGSDLNRSTYQETSSLRLTLVPKTFKSFRSIMPNTTIGSYMSFGLGEMIRKRLRREGYDIKSLQMRHRYLAREASIHGLYATADLSSASDSITTALVEQLFPRDWFKILNQSRIGTVVLPNGQSIESKTFCTMGIGYTFPLQTLVFLSILKAIQATMYDRKDRRTISVYGDDMIYATRMHDAVLKYFKMFGFVINIDKTFHEGSFRESCGGDYFRGVDVRPFQPQNGPATVGLKTYEAILYKFANGLLARWSEYEIGNTLKLLCNEIRSVTSKVKLVPGDYPDDSGIKCPTLTHYKFLMGTDCANPVHVGHGVFRFSFLRLAPDRQKEERHDPYYWSCIRGGALQSMSYMHRKRASMGSASRLGNQIDYVIGVRARESLLVTKEDRPIKTFRSKISGCRLRRTSTYVTISHTGRYKRQSGTSCFEDRR